MGTAASLAGGGSSSSGYVDERDSLPDPHDVADAGVPSGVSLASIPEAEEGVALVSAAMEVVARGLHATGAMEPPALVLGQLQAMYGRHQVTLIVPHLAVALFLTRLEGRLLQGPLMRALAESLFSATATADAAAVAYAAAVKAADAAYAADVRAGTGAGAKAAKTAKTAKTAKRGAGAGSASATAAAAAAATADAPSSDSSALASVAAEHDGLRAFVLGHLSSPCGGSVDSLATCVAAVAAALGRRNQYSGRAGGARIPPTSLDPSVDELRAFDALDQGVRSKAKAESEEKRSSELNQGLRGAQLATETAVPRASPDIAHVLRLDTGLVPPRLPPPPPRGDDSSDDSSDDEDDEKKRGGGGGGVQGSNVEVWNPSVDERQWASSVLPPLTRGVFVLKVQQVQDAWRWQRRQDEGRDAWERSRSRRTKRYDDEEEELLSGLRRKLSPRGCAEARAARVKGVGEFWDEDWDASGTCEWVFKRGGEWWHNRGMALMGKTGADGMDGGETKSTGSEGTSGSRVVLISGGIGMGKTMLVVNCITRFPRHVVGHLFCDLLGRRGGTRWGGGEGGGGGAAREAVMSLSAQLCEHSELGRKYVWKRTVGE